MAKLDVDVYVQGRQDVMRVVGHGLASGGIDYSGFERIKYWGDKRDHCIFLSTIVWAAQFLGHFAGSRNIVIVGDGEISEKVVPGVDTQTVKEYSSGDVYFLVDSPQKKLEDLVSVSQNKDSEELR